MRIEVVENGVNSLEVDDDRPDTTELRYLLHLGPCLGRAQAFPRPAVAAEPKLSIVNINSYANNIGGGKDRVDYVFDLRLDDIRGARDGRSDIIEPEVNLPIIVADERIAVVSEEARRADTIPDTNGHAIGAAGGRVARCRR